RPDPARSCGACCATSPQVATSGMSPRCVTPQSWTNCASSSRSAATAKIRPPGQRTPDMSEPDDEARWRERLTPEQYAVTRRGATERAFTGVYWDHHGTGTYRCVCCGEALFASSDKFESGSGWPSFTQPPTDAGVDENR